MPDVGARTARLMNCGTNSFNYRLVMVTKATVLGGGAMGTACSVVLAEAAHRTVSLWVRNSEYAGQINNERENKRLLPGVRLADSVNVTSDIEDAVRDTELLVLAIPTAYLRNALSQHAAVLDSGCSVVSVIKGIENDTLLRPSEIIREFMPNSEVVALGGPSHAEEFARRLPASVVAAGENSAANEQVQSAFTTDRFRVYTNSDIIGVELGGALKNVIAIAAGICDGLGYGDNSKSALMTRGQVEMTRFGLAQGAEAATFSGLAGMGDLITTCISPYGRNRRVGERLGRGESLDEILESTIAVAEGVTTARSVFELAQQNDIDMPITSEVYKVLFEDKLPEEATNSLMLRPPRDE